MLKSKLEIIPLPIQMPILGEENQKSNIHGDFQGQIISLIEMELLNWQDKDGKVFQKIPISQLPLDQVSQETRDNAKKARDELIEEIASLDDQFLEIYLKYEDPSKIPIDEIHFALRRITLANKGYPILFGASFQNKGVQPLMDSIINYLPSPMEKKDIIAEDLDDPSNHVKFNPKTTNQLCALAYKVITDKQRGLLVFLRVYSGNKIFFFFYLFLFE